MENCYCTTNERPDINIAQQEILEIKTAKYKRGQSKLGLFTIDLIIITIGFTATVVAGRPQSCIDLSS